MKKIILSLSIILCVITLTKAQPKTIPHELIVYLPYVDKMKNLQQVVDIVTSVKEAKAVAYCEDFRCLLIRINGNYPKNSERLFEQFKKAGMAFNIKKDATIQQVLSECKTIVSPQTNWQ